MSENTLRTLVGFEIIGIHMTIFAVLLLLWVKGGFSNSEATTIMGLIFPIFSGYCAAIISHFVDHRVRRRRSTTSVTWPFIVLAIASPLGLGVAVLIVIVSQAYGLLYDFDTCKIILLAIETGLAANVGTIVYAIYGREAGSPSHAGH